ncbi:MAG: DUF424 family protein [Candidatus Micrarchaeota archaeon]|nr:DUF424 family protein [Candidatus Micrarchaeota archaeon]
MIYKVGVGWIIYIKIHDTENGDMVAMCDSSLIDKVLTDGDVEINIKDYSDFYKEKLVDIEKASKMISPERLYSANIIGKESVEASIRSNIIDKDNVKYVGKVPYAHAFRIKY